MDSSGLSGCYGLNVYVSQNPYVEALIPNVVVFGGEGLCKVIRSRE